MMLKSAGAPLERADIMSSAFQTVNSQSKAKAPYSSSLVEAEGMGPTKWVVV